MGRLDVALSLKEVDYHVASDRPAPPATEFDEFLFGPDWEFDSLTYSDPLDI
ncbi:MAG: hypothetical protein ACU0CO_12490 [Shimia sp.]